MASATYRKNIFEIGNAISLPGGSGECLFDIRTNLDISWFSFDVGDAYDWLSVTADYDFIGAQTPDAEGCKIWRYKFTHRENHSTSPRSATATITIDAEIAVASRSVAITQQANRGDVVIGDYVGEFVEMAGLRWYPVNCGFDATHPYGLLYQWGRKFGQGYEGETPAATLVPLNVDPENSVGLSTPEDNSVYFYRSYKWPGNQHSNAYDGRWYSWSNEVAPSEDWVDVNEKIGNPCPEGWRVPTQDEWRSLIDCYEGLDQDKTTLRYYMKFSENGKAIYLPFGGSFRAGFSGITGAMLLVYESRNTGGRYWSSTRLDIGVKYATMSGTNSFSAKPTCEESGYESYGQSVRCVQTIEAE